jgi:two-component system, OmpR family, response regulator
MTVTTATYTGAVQVAYRVHEMRETPHGPATARAHVLTVDDDPVIQEAISEYLRQYEFRVTAAASGAEMQAVLAGDVVDLIVLDFTLRAEDGAALLRRLRDQSAIPIVVLTGRREEADRVMGLELGADDYLTKPFSPRELLARIRAVLRRRRHEVHQGRPEGVRAYRFDGWELNLNTRRLRDHNGQTIPLSNGEFSLLVVFLGTPNRVLSRDQLLDMSRLHSDDVYSRSVNTQVMRLRRKLEADPTNPRYIRTERGAGYQFGVPVETIY